jgi:hypothetical protein
VVGGDLAVCTVADQDGALLVGDGAFRVAAGEVDAATAALRVADAVGDTGFRMPSQILFRRPATYQHDPGSAYR